MHLNIYKRVPKVMARRSVLFPTRPSPMMIIRTVQKGARGRELNSPFATRAYGEKRARFSKFIE